MKGVKIALPSLDMQTTRYDTDGDCIQLLFNLLRPPEHDIVIKLYSSGPLESHQAVT